MVRVEFEGHRFVLSIFQHFVKLHPCKTLLRISVHTQLTGRRDADGRIFCPPMTTKQCQRKTDRRDGTFGWMDNDDGTKFPTKSVDGFTFRGQKSLFDFFLSQWVACPFYSLATLLSSDLAPFLISRISDS